MNINLNTLENYNHLVSKHILSLPGSKEKENLRKKE